MAYSIALAGKGGTGKTTMAGLLVKYLAEKGKIPILAVDADANANLNEVLGLEVKETVGEAREQMKTEVSSGMTKDMFMDMKIQEAVVETSSFDLVVMGRPEGPGCYCAANTLLTQYLDKLMDNYAFVVIDNEAGMEHISRLTTTNVDILLIVSDATRRGLQAAARIEELANQLGLNIDCKELIVNQVGEGQDKAIVQVAQEYHLNLVGMVPEDPIVKEYDLRGRPTIELGKESNALKAAYHIFDKIFAT